MTTSEERASALRARLAGASLEGPRDSIELANLSTRAMLRDSGYAIAESAPKLDVRLHGRSIPGHEIPVREATSILGSLQEAVSACGQAVAKKATAAGSVQSAILRATELRLSPALGFGSVVFHLGGAAESLEGDEAPDGIGSDILLDRVFRDLFAILNSVASDDLGETTTVDSLKLLGPRTVRHLNDLAKEVTESEIDIDLSWLNGSGSANASLHRRGALALKDAIQRTREEVEQKTFHGTLSTVSTLVHPQLLADDGQRIDMSVSPEEAARLGDYFNRRVVVEVEQTTTWSVTTGKETLRYRLLTIGFAEEISA